MDEMHLIDLGWYYMIISNLRKIVKEYFIFYLVVVLGYLIQVCCGYFYLVNRYGYLMLILYCISSINNKG